MLPSVLMSQIINTEDMRLDADTNGWYGGFTESVFANKDKTKNYGFNLAVNTSIRKNKHLFLLVGTTGYNKNGEVIIMKRAFTYFKHNYEITNNISTEVLYQFTYDDRVNVKSRQLIGAGLRYEVHKKLSFGSVIMNEDEVLVDGTSEHNIRFSGYHSWVHNFSDNVCFKTVTYIQPTINKPKNFRLSTENKFQFKITDKFMFGFMVNYSYDAFPAPNIDKHLYNLSNALTFKF